LQLISQILKTFPMRLNQQPSYRFLSQGIEKGYEYPQKPDPDLGIQRTI
jgi:hypothetical protein